VTGNEDVTKQRAELKSDPITFYSLAKALSGLVRECSRAQLEPQRTDSLNMEIGRIASRTKA
jgi:hypothetical protein